MYIIQHIRSILKIGQQGKIVNYSSQSIFITAYLIKIFLSHINRYNLTVGLLHIS